MKVETHNHPTAISPFPGAATGSGGEIRDEGATGRGAKPKAGLTGFSVSHLRIPGFGGRGSATFGKPGAHRLGARHHDRRAARRAPRSTTSSAGRRSAATSAPSSSTVAGDRAQPRARLSQADHDRRRPRQRPPRARREGRGAGRREARRARRPGDADRPGRRRGLVASAAAPRAPTSISPRCSAATPEMQRRARKSSIAAGRWATTIPIVLDPRRRRRRPVERAAGGRGAQRARRAHRPARDPERRARHVAARDLVQRGAGALRAGDRRRRARRVRGDRARASAARSRWSATIDGRRPAASSSDPLLGDDAGRHAARRAARQAAAHDARRAQRRSRRARRFDATRVDLREAAYRVLRLPAVADKTFLITIGDRTVGGLISARSDGRPLAGAGRRRRGHARRLTTAMPARRWRWASARRSRCSTRRPRRAWRSARRSPTSLARRYRVAVARSRLSANWMAAAASRARTRALYDDGARGRQGAVSRARHRDPGRQGLAVDAAPTWQRRRQQQQRRRAGVADRLRVRAGRRTCAARSRRQLQHDERPDVAVAHRSRRAAATASAARRWRRSTASSATSRPISTIRSGCCSFVAALAELRAAGLLLAYHDRSDGGLFVTLLEMAFAGHCGLDIELPAARGATRSRSCSPRSSARCCRSWPTTSRACRGHPRAARPRRRRAARSARRCSELRVRIRVGDGRVLDESLGRSARAPGRRPRSRMRRLRDDPQCADEEYAAQTATRTIPGSTVALTLRSRRGHRRAVHRARRAAGGRDPARAGRQQPDRDGRGVRSRRLRRRTTCT